MTYREAWDNILTPCVQFSCRICPDHTGEQADISCGDPWYREIEKNDPGRSLVLIRTETGREIFHAAHKTGYIKTSKGDPSIVGASQISILQNRRHLYGRLLAMNIMGLPVPVYSGFNLKENFRDISISEKIKSIAGTAKRIITRGMLFPDKLQRITLKNKIISTL
jgi:coenzyme F420 hydrogenase subunit beta